MPRKIVNLIVLVPLAVILIVLCVANRQAVTLALNPFRPEDALLSFTAPFFLFLLVAVMVGMVIGALATWISQGRHRKRVRLEAREALRWHAEADRQKAAAAQAVQTPPQLPAR